MRCVLAATLAAFVLVPAPSLAGKIGRRGADSHTDISVDPYPVRRHVHYSVTIRNTSATLVRAAAVRAIAPVDHPAAQKSIEITASMPFEMATDAVGNQTLTFRVTLAPFASKIIAVDAIVALAEERRPERLKERKAYLAADQFAEVDDPAIQAAAASIGSSGDAALAPQLVAWASDQVADAGYVSERRGALFALAEKRGDCTDAADLLVAVARARALPARRVSGFVVDGDSVVRSADYHDWAEVYVQGAWRIADPNKRVFDSQSPRYVSMRIFSSSPNDIVGGRRATVSDPRLLVAVE